MAAQNTQCLILISQTLSELLEKVKSADSGRVIEKYGKEVVERLEQLKRSRGRIVSEEMNSVIQEKDNAIARVFHFFILKSFVKINNSII